MSDQITEQEIRRRLVIFLRIPNETWTDILKLFPRRTLIQNISPVCCRLKNICNRNVKAIHEIKEADRFNNKLRRGDPEANQQLEQLAGNNCQLASQFRLIRIKIIPENMVILRHCIELFRGCRLWFSLLEDRNMALIAERLTHLEAAKPSAITINLYNSKWLLFLRHPTVWNCSRISIISKYGAVDGMSIVVPFLDWLHHQQPTRVDVNGDGAGQEEVRCSIIRFYYKEVQDAIDWLINGCIQNFQQNQGPKDRRRFELTFSFSAWNWNRADEFPILDRYHNQMTGEVLLLERAGANREAMVYHLRRCLAEEADNGNNEFYAKTFKRNGPWDGLDGPMVNIEY